MSNGVDKKSPIQDDEVHKVESVAMGMTEDEARLAQLGHTQELGRQFSLFSLGAMCLCLMATWEALSTVIAAALVSGGPPCLFYNYVLSFLFTVAIACSLGEIASIYPTAGGQYHWVAALSPPSIRSSLSFFTGWISVGGLLVFTASAAFAAGLQTQSLIVLNDETYVPQRYQGMLFYWAVILYAAAMNIWGAKLLPWANNISGILHITAFISIFIVLAVMAPKNTASFVFTEFQNNSGWENNGISWLVGLLSTVYPFLGYDAACHLAEEMPNASRNVPIAMVGSIVVNGIMGLGYCIMLLYSAGSLDALLTTPTGFPFMQIYLDVTKSPAGATVMSLALISIAIAATVACLTSASRTLWAFARDQATPFHSYLSHVDKDKQIPVRAVLVLTVLQLLLGFIYIGNTQAFNAILAMAIIGLYVSYMLPIICMLFRGRKIFRFQDYGPFKLGKTLGPILNVLSIIWMTVVIIFSTFPTVMPVTPENMNYSIVVMSGWTFFGVVYYYLAGGKAKFLVPVVGIEEVSMAVPISPTKSK